MQQDEVGAVHVRDQGPPIRTRICPAECTFNNTITTGWLGNRIIDIIWR